MDPEGIATQQAPPAVGTVIVPTAVSISMTQAWGSQVLARVKYIPTMASKYYYLISQSVTADGKSLLATSNFFSLSETDPHQPGKIVIVDLTSGQITEIATVSDSNITPYGVTGDENWIVWTQAPKEPGFFSTWTMYAYNRADHSIKQIAQAAKEQNGLPPLGSDGSAQVDHGKVVWSEAIPDQGDTPRNAVKIMDLPTGQVTTLSSNGYIPVISWPYAAWIDVKVPQVENTPAQTPLDVQVSIVVLNLEDGTRKALTKPDRPVGFDLYKDSVVWISDDRRRVLLTNIDETFEQTIAVVSGGGIFESPSINERLIVWHSSTEAQVWDRKKNQLVTLASEGVTRRFVSPRTLVWDGPQSDAPDAPRGTQVLDTTELP
ncbi:MAG: hypothetical protein M3437_07210 [Chloroflexota bacterium]|nr:hypothetical protein [Chloroflexota bacterium]MDQ5867669.1 hypothetical protein [Chloroflexota bacterium]